MSASPTSAVASAKRPLEDPSSPAGPTDLPDAKRQALDKTHDDAESEEVKPAMATATTTVEPTEPPPTVETNGSSTTAPEPAAQENGNGLTIDTSTIPQPVPLTSAIDSTTGQPTSSFPTQDESQWIHIRAVISSSEAATVIGKGGENVTQIRRLSGAKCTVSDYSRGAVERILTVSGAQDAVAKVGRAC